MHCMWSALTPRVLPHTPQVTARKTSIRKHSVPGNTLRTVTLISKVSVIQVWVIRGVRKCSEILNRRCTSVLFEINKCCSAYSRNLSHGAEIAF